MDEPLHFDDSRLVALGLALDFGPDDLDHNRDGVLSPGQVARLEADLRHFYWPLIGAFAALAVMMGLAGLTAGGLALLPVAFLLICAAVPAFLFSREIERLPERPALRAVLLASSAGEPDAFGRIRLLAQDGIPIFARRRIGQALRDGQAYVVYYAPVRTWSGFRALSIEPDDAPEPKRER